MNEIDEHESETLGRLLRAEREAAGVTQVEIAEALGVDQSLISRQESGDSKLDYLQVFEYLEIVGVSFQKFAAKFEQAVRKFKS